MAELSGQVALTTAARRGTHRAPVRRRGRVVYSRSFLHSLGCGVYSLNGQKLLGDAELPADSEATA
jgi:hypothetical protein